MFRELLQKVEQNPHLTKAIESSSELEQQWIDLLAEKKLPAFKIICVDGQKYPPFRQLIARFYFDLYKTPSDQVFLNKACEWASYSALDERIKINTGLLEKSKDFETMRKLADIIFNDCQKYHNHYWTPGYIRAALTLKDVAMIYNNFKPTDLCELKNISADQTHPAGLAKFYFSAALECIFMAELLENHPTSKALQPFFIVATPFKNWTEAMQDIIEQAKLTSAEVDELRKNAKGKVQKLALSDLTEFEYKNHFRK